MNNKPTKGIPVPSKIPTSGRDSGTHSRSSSISNLTTASDIHSEAGDAASDIPHDFKINDRVWVNGTKPGYIKFIGNTEFAAGIWAGIRLDEQVGKNDGSVNGVKYFSCEPARGIFARPHKLTRSAATGTGDSNAVGTSSPRTPMTASIHSSRGSAASNVSPSSSRSICSKLRLGERVVVSSTTGVKSGILRFIGETEFAKGDWAGIELDEPVGKNDGSVAGKRYFSCQMKYGLFSPMHKVSRAGGTSTPRPASARGTPLARSTSRDSLSSSISNTSRSSRVKLGVTSLTSAQKTRGSGSGIVTNSRVLEEVLKEKELHIEQLLKELELERAEFAKMAVRYSELEATAMEFKKQQMKAEHDRKNIETQLLGDKRKLEDFQFQLEEEKIGKSDLEMQLQQNNCIFKRLEEYSSKELGDKYINIKEIIEGMESLSEIVEEPESALEVQKLKSKINQLEDSLKLLLEEKNQTMNEVSRLQDLLKESEGNNEKLSGLNNTIQEKDEVISNLKKELSCQLEKLAEVSEQNKSLNDLINLQAAQAKGETDAVIKELGEKVNLLSEELKTKSNLLQEKEVSIQKYVSEISALRENLTNQAQILTESQTQNKNLTEAMQQKDFELSEKLAIQKSLEDEVAVMKSEMNSEVSNKDQKINLLSEELKTKSNLLQEKEQSVQEKGSEIFNLRQSLETQTQLLSESESQKNTLSEALKLKSLELDERLGVQKSLEDEVTTLKSQTESEVSTKEKKILGLVKEIESVTCSLQEKEEALLLKQSEISGLLARIKDLEETNNEMQLKLQESQEIISLSTKDNSKKINILQSEINQLKEEKEQAKCEYEKQIHTVQGDFKALCEELQFKKDVIAEKESEVLLLNEKLNVYEGNLVEKTNDLVSSKEMCQGLETEKQEFLNLLKAKEELISDLEKQIQNFEKLLEKMNDEALEKEKEASILQQTLKQKNEEIIQIHSKLQLAEQKVEMLNKDSSDHVMTLQNELSKLKEESVTVKTHLQQELAEVQKEKEKLSTVITKTTNDLKEKEEILHKLQNDTKEKETEISNLSGQIENLKKEIISLTKCKDDLQTSHQRQFSVATSEFDAKLQKKEQVIEALNIKLAEQIEQVNKKQNELQKKESDLNNFENLVKDKDSETEELNNKIQTLQAQLVQLTELNDRNMAMLQSKDSSLNNFKLEQEVHIQGLEKALEDSKLKLSEYVELISTKDEELHKRENDINVLKNLVNEKDSQFDELTGIIQTSQKQLAQLKEQNDNNILLLQNKESVMNDFKAEQGKCLQEKEQLFKEEISKLQALNHKNEEEKNEKEELISRLKCQQESDSKQIKVLEAQLNIMNLEKDKTVQHHEKINKDYINRIADLEKQYFDLLAEKEKIANEELKARNAKKDLEHMRDTLLQEKVQQEEIVKDREAKLETLQDTVNRMQTEFTQHKHELQSKLDISEMELQAALELKNQLELQHSVLEEMQQELQNSENKCESLEMQVKDMVALTAERDQLQKKIKDLEIDKEKYEKLIKIEEKSQALEEMLSNNQNILKQKELELLTLKQQLVDSRKNTDSKDLKSSFQLIEEENKVLKNKISKLEASGEKKNINDSSAEASASQLDTEEKDSLYSQIDFLNSIIVDMKQKNEELSKQLELQKTCWEPSDLNKNDTKKSLAPRLFCDICDMFDLHDTEDCPKQESFLEEEVVPHLRPPGSRLLEERPYCNNCGMFGHWTLDCDEPEETY